MYKSIMIFNDCSPLYGYSIWGGKKGLEERKTRKWARDIARSSFAGMVAFLNFKDDKTVKIVEVGMCYNHILESLLWLFWQRFGKLSAVRKGNSTPILVNQVSS